MRYKLLFRHRGKFGRKLYKKFLFGKSFKVSANTRNAYEIVWDSSALQVTCAGRTITVSLKAYDTAIREAQQADFTLLSVHQEWMLTEQRGTELAALLQSDEIQVALSPQGQIRAKAL